MEIRILIDNKKDRGLVSEWGFCVYIEKDNKKILLDTGASNRYLINANKLGIDISDVDYAVLSHSHIDHSGGYDSFFKVNSKAKLYISKNSTSQCYCKIGFLKFNVGIPQNILDNYKDRIVYVNGLYELTDNIYIMEHLKRDYKNKLLLKKVNNKYVYDDFSHEQNLIIDTMKGLVVLNSCSHIGIDEILKEVKTAFPDKKIYMMVGGLHLAGKSKKYDMALADRIKELDVDYIYTGHCTKEKAYKILKKELGEKIIQVKCGMKIDI